MRTYLAAVVAGAFLFLMGAYLRDRAYRREYAALPWVDITCSMPDGTTYTYRGLQVGVDNPEDIQPYDPYTVGYTH